MLFYMQLFPTFTFPNLWIFHATFKKGIGANCVPAELWIDAFLLS